MTKSKNFLNNLMKTFGFTSTREGSNDEDLEKIAAQEQKDFPFETLAAATKNFHPTHKLGEGGFGPVFKGKLESGRDIAVKKLSQSSSQGKKEFMNEARLLARVQHRNVVNLLGYCAHGVEKLLVYEYVANESLDKLLFNCFHFQDGTYKNLDSFKFPDMSVKIVFEIWSGEHWIKAVWNYKDALIFRPRFHYFGELRRPKSNRREELDWKRRYDIICGIARGLLYLHEDSHNCIIHRDIKASNILLDDKWVPKIADFGMARLFPEDQTHVNTRVAGTNGYMAPEYVMHGHLSVKADVFSFGVLVLELISGQRNSSFSLNVDAQSLLEWAYKLYKKGRSLEIMDLTLASSAVTEQVAMCIQMGLLCIQGDPQQRPTMHRVVVILSKKPSNLEEPSRPGEPGSRYRRSGRPVGLSSTVGTSGESNSRTTNSSFTATGTTSATVEPDLRGKTGTTSGTTSARADPRRSGETGTTSARVELDLRGKRPVER